MTFERRRNQASFGEAILARSSKRNCALRFFPGRHGGARTVMTFRWPGHGDDAPAARALRKQLGGPDRPLQLLIRRADEGNETQQLAATGLAQTACFMTPLQLNRRWTGGSPRASSLCPHRKGRLRLGRTAPNYKRQSGSGFDSLRQSRHLHHLAGKISALAEHINLCASSS